MTGRIYVVVGAVLVAGAALGGHLLITDGLEDRITTLDGQLAGCQIESATAATNAATLRSELDRVRADLATAEAQAARDEQKRREAVSNALAQLDEQLEADRAVGPEPEEMNKWLSELF